MHTPGPWTTEGENILAAKVPVALVRNIDDTRATLDANARLIASAPTMLEALEGLDPAHQGDQQGAAYWLPCHQHPLHHDERGCPWCLRNTAIAAAKGE